LIIFWVWLGLVYHVLFFVRIEAINLVKDKKAQLAIVHVIDFVITNGAGDFSGTYIDATHELARNTIEQASKTAKAILGRVDPYQWSSDPAL
jgi:hypothetical protein